MQLLATASPAGVSTITFSNIPISKNLYLFGSCIGTTSGFMEFDLNGSTNTVGFGTYSRQNGLYSDESSRNSHVISWYTYANTNGISFYVEIPNTDFSGNGAIKSSLSFAGSSDGVEMVSSTPYQLAGAAENNPVTSMNVYVRGGTMQGGSKIYLYGSN